MLKGHLDAILLEHKHVHPVLAVPLAMVERAPAAGMLDDGHLVKRRVVRTDALHPGGGTLRETR